MALTYKMRNGEQGQGLRNLCAFVQNLLGDKLSIIEIGSYCGEGSSIIAQHFPNSILNCVDPWTGYTEDCSVYDLNRQILELQEAEQLFDDIKSHQTNIYKNKMPSTEYAAKINDHSIDLVYIDGNHQYSSVVEDLNSWFVKVRPGAIIAGHDYSWDSVKKALHEFFGRPPDATFIDSSWAYIKPL